MKTIAEVKAEFAAADISSYPALYEIYKDKNDDDWYLNKK